MAIRGSQGRVIALLLLTGLLTVALLGLQHPPARAANACTGANGTVTSFATLQSDVAASGTYRLGADLTASSGERLALASGVHVTLDLAGCDLDITAPAAGDAAIAVPAGASLTIEDSSGSGELTASAASGAGIGGDGTATSGSVTVAGTGTVTLDATLGGSLDVTAGATLSVPAGDTLAVNTADQSATSTNAGEIDLAGTLSGDGTLANTGAIVVSGSGWSIPGNGDGNGKNGDLTITHTIYGLTFTVPSGHTAPAPVWVYAPTLTSGGESLPTQPAEAGYEPVWESGSTEVSDTSALAGLPSLKLTGVYLADTSVTSSVTVPSAGSLVDTATVSRASGRGSPGGSVSFYVCGPLSAPSGCTSTANEVSDGVSLTPAGASTSTAPSSTFTPPAAGIYCFHTVYSATGSYVGSSDATTGCGTVQEPTAVSTPSASANPLGAGATLTLSATVTNASGSEALNGGTVSFLDASGATVCTATVTTSGLASCGVSTLGPGIHQITATYGGDAQFLPSTESTPLTEDIDTPSSTSTRTSTSTVSRPSNLIRLVSARAARTGRLTLTLRAPDAGHLTVTVTVTRARRTVVYATRGATTAKARTLSLTLIPRAAARALIGSRHGREALALTVTFTPTGGTRRTLRSTLTLPAARRGEISSVKE